MVWPTAMRATPTSVCCKLRSKYHLDFSILVYWTYIGSFAITLVHIANVYYMSIVIIAAAAASWHVMYFWDSQCRCWQETDAGLLSIISYPAFAVDDPELIDLTRTMLLDKLRVALFSLFTATVILLMHSNRGIENAECVHLMLIHVSVRVYWKHTFTTSLTAVLAFIWISHRSLKKTFNPGVVFLQLDAFPDDH